ncbi:MAG: hypothetical protein GX228_02965 [Firmicutes bacterium]|jgi:menaquinone-dependent protoporphyrinogen oxidase|nr:flavodoxin domain-containing protein [Bacillota bacterium]NLL87880.1 hypothetical protein [Bacillota bacterium]HKM18411.1 flavodoxin domain-containing protein [Limnochordia bacterium]
MKTVIVYGSKYGCTAQCAELLKERLSGEVELHNAAESGHISLQEYDQAVIGSPVYMGKILPQISRFCQAGKGTD